MPTSKLKYQLGWFPNLVIFYKDIKRNEKLKNKFFEIRSLANNTLLTPYEIDYQSAKCKKSRAISIENLPAAVDVVYTMIDEYDGKLLLEVPLSNNMN